MHPQVVSIAKETRVWAEQYGSDHGFPYDLCGVCAIAAAELHTRLVEAGYSRAQIAASESHCFVLMDDHVIDVTASQFGREKVLMAHTAELRDDMMWDFERRFSSAELLIEWQEKASWPISQIAVSRAP